MKQVFTLTETISRQQSALKELQAEVRDLTRTINEDVRRLESKVERLAAEIRHVQEREESERRVLRLELENYLLRKERGLSSGEQGSPTE